MGIDGIVIHTDDDFGVPQVNTCTALDTLALSFPLKTSRSWGIHFAAVNHCIENLFAALRAEKLNTVVFHLDIAYADKQFEQLQLECLHRFLYQLPYLQSIVIVTRQSSVFKARKDITRALEPFRHMLRVRASDGPEDLSSLRVR